MTRSRPGIPQSSAGWPAALLALATFSPLPAHAQTTFSGGLEMRSGDYGRSSSTEELRLPFAIRHATGSWVLRAGADFSRVQGVANAIEREARRTADPTLSPDDDDDDDDDDNSGGGGGGGGGPAISAADAARTATGLGDGQFSAFYKALSPAEAGFGLEVGGRMKVPLSSADECFITNGEIDYSVEARVSRPVGRVEPSFTLGWTKRGDPVRRDSLCQPIGNRRVDFRDPFYFGIGVGADLSAMTTLDIDYFYREKLLPQSAPLSLLRATVQFRLSDLMRLGVYGATGFTDASPDWILGTSVGVRF